jgi:CRP-like cAMP-binding protein
MELRVLAMTGQLCFVVYNLGQKIILWPSIMWSATFAAVNAWNIHKIIDERTASVHMTDDQERVFVHFFMPHGVTPKQFERIEHKARVFKLKKGQLLIRKGEKLDHVYLIIEGSTQAHILGRRLTAASTNDESRGDQKEGGDSGAWAGEMTFLKQYWEKEQRKIAPADPEETARAQEDNDSGPSKGPASSQNPSAKPFERAFYTIIAAEDCSVMSWSHNDLEELLESSTDMRAAMTRAMSSALVGKVVNLTISRTQHDRVPWLVWLTDWKSKDGSIGVVEVSESSMQRLAEDTAY